MTATETSEHRPIIVWDPRVRSGQPQINRTRVTVEDVGGTIWAGETVDTVADEYNLTRADVLTACWWLGLHGTRDWRRRFGGWAAWVDSDLGSGRYDVPDPPGGGDPVQVAS